MFELLIFLGHTRGLLGGLFFWSGLERFVERINFCLLAP